MSNLFQLKNSDLFIELSEQEQEVIAGGFGLSSLLGFEDLFFDHTEIHSSAGTTSTITDLAGNTTSYSSNSDYTLERTTFAVRRSFNFNTLMRLFLPKTYIRKFTQMLLTTRPY